MIPAARRAMGWAGSLGDKGTVKSPEQRHRD